MIDRQRHFHDDIGTHRRCIVDHRTHDRRINFDFGIDVITIENLVENVADLFVHEFDISITAT